MIVKAALVGLLYWISMGRAQYFFSFAFRKPVVLGVFIGLVFGDVQAGLLYGATIQLMYMGGIEAGGNIPSDQGLAACIAIPAAIAGGFVLPWLTNGVLYFTPVFIATWLGTSVVQSFISIIPQWLMNGLANAGNMLPALGFALTLVVMGKQKYLPFFVLGFFLYAILGFSMLTGAVIAVCLALIVSLFVQEDSQEVDA